MIAPSRRTENKGQVQDRLTLAQYMRSAPPERPFTSRMRLRILAFLIAFAGCSCTKRAFTPQEDTCADRVTEAYELRLSADYDQAKQALDLALEEEPENAGAWFELARLEFYLAGRTQEMAAAQEAISRAVEFEPTSSLYSQWAARIAMYRGILMAHEQDSSAMAEQFAIAIKSANDAVAIDPDDHVARRLLVSLYGNNPPDFGGDVLFAEEQVEALEDRSPIHGAAARCEFSYKGKPDQKLAVWEKFARKYDTDSRFHENIAKEFAITGNVTKATEHANRAIELNPESGHVLMELSRMFALNRQVDDAERFANRYIDYEPAGPRALRAWTYFAISKFQRTRGNIEASAASAEKAEELDSQSWPTMTPPPRELFDAP
ncbi:MAG: tetratricopeptide (TPR) repeat protein [Verrucomicrobiales bacterium]|jgi:tetratricopeptide (TPR) repeat protein